MRNAIAICILVPLAFGLPLAGCGGDDGASDSGSAAAGSGTAAAGEDREGGGVFPEDAPSISKADFVEQASDICGRVVNKLAVETNSVGARETAKPGVSPAEAQAIIGEEVLIPGFETELAEIRALGVPDEGTEEAEAFLRAMEKLIDAGRKNPRAAVKSAKLYEPVELAGTRYGISSCPLSPVATE